MSRRKNKKAAAAAAAAEAAAAAAAEKIKPRKKSRHPGRKLFVLLLGAGIALAVSADLRNKVLDALFGAEEEFDYTSTTAPSTPAPAPSPAAAS
jgi:hypothetical protein